MQIKVIQYNSLNDLEYPTDEEKNKEKIDDGSLLMINEYKLKEKISL